LAERDLAAAVPLAGLLGIEIDSAEPAEVRGTLPWAPERCTAGGVCAFLNLPAGVMQTQAVLT
jgi:1,4-dihydroxy-2-naphthoyl-CoA hydrolase